jgi:Uma2 family endonuclease
LYEEAGVLEYWIVEPIEKMILIYTLINGKYIGFPTKVEGNNLKSPLFPNLQIEIKDIFEDIN